MHDVYLSTETLGNNDVSRPARSQRHGPGLLTCDSTGFYVERVAQNGQMGLSMPVRLAMIARESTR